MVGKTVQLSEYILFCSSFKVYYWTVKSNRITI